MGNRPKQSVDLKAKGLHTFENPLDLDPGSLTIALNIVADRPGTTETRRGFRQYGTALVDAHTSTSYQDRLIVHDDDLLKYDSDNAGTWVAYTGTFEAPSIYRMKFAESNKNLYFTTALGIGKLDSVTGVPRQAGVPQALGGSAAVTGSSGFFINNSNLAYRITYAYTDANDNLIEGAPSQRITVTNTSGGTRNVALTFVIPDEITTDYVYRVYRSPATSATAIEPIDDMQLVIEANPTSGQIAAGIITVTDITPDALKGAALYTGSNQEGIAQANTRPPLAQDIALYKGSMLYANTETIQNFEFTLQTTLTNGDTITIGGVVYTAGASEVVATGTFKAFTGGTLADDIESTALSIVSVINQYVSNTTVYAYYISGYNDLPGQIRIESRLLGTPVFTTQSSNGTAFSPELVNAQNSTNDDNPNYIYVSKDQQPEAVPILNYLPIGSANYGIQRILPLRDLVLVWKEGEGIFAIYGNDITDFQVLPFDSTVRILAPDSAVTFNNAGYAYTDQGVVATSNASGSPIMSRAIERQLVELSSDLYPFFNTATWAVGYESDRKYVLGTVSAFTDERATQLFVYNALTDCWTKWDLAAVMGIVSPADGKLYLLQHQQMLQERKTFTRLDYADDELAVTIVGQVGQIVQLTDTTGIEVGDSLFQANDADGIDAVIEEVTDATHVVIGNDETFAAGAALVYSPIHTETEWAPIYLDNPALVKHFQEICVFFRVVDFDALAISYATDLVGGISDDVLAPIFGIGWEEPPEGWDSVGWEGGTSLPQGIRRYIPFGARRARWIVPKITTDQALTSFACTGISILGQWTSTRTK